MKTISDVVARDGLKVESLDTVCGTNVVGFLETGDKTCTFV